MFVPATGSLPLPPPNLLLILKTLPLVTTLPPFLPSQPATETFLEKITLWKEIIGNGNARINQYPSNPVCIFLTRSCHDSRAPVSNLEFSVSGGVSLLYSNKPVWLEISTILTFLDFSSSIYSLNNFLFHLPSSLICIHDGYLDNIIRGKDTLYKHF